MKHQRLPFALVMVLAGCATAPARTSRFLADGMAALDKGDTEAAIEAFDAGLARNPDDERLLYDKALALVLQGDGEAARNVCDQGYAAHPEVLKFLLLKAQSLQNDGDAPAAITAYDDVLLRDPADTALRLEVIEYAKAQGYAEEARFHARYLIEHDQETLRAWQTLAELDGEGSDAALVAAYLADNPPQR